MNAAQKTILIIEDEIDLSMLVKKRLEKLGYNVILAADGEDGLQKAKKEKVDLVILDLMLPKLNGEEVCKQIRREDRIKEVPIIMLTARGQDSDRVIGKVIGANSYLVKPCESAILIAEISKLI